MNLYARFLESIKEIYALRSAQALLGWDQETNMPARGGEGRATALATLSKVIQEKYCDERLGEMLTELELSSGLKADAVSIVHEIKKDRTQLLKIPVSLTQELAHTTSLAQQAWSEALNKKSAQDFLPWLERVLNLLRQKAECLGYENEPYDAMLDIYEPQMTAQKVGNSLEEIKSATLPLLEQIAGKPRMPDAAFKNRVFPEAAQSLFCREVVRDMTFHLEAGRLDTSVHPFTEGIWPTDVRLTTRYDEADITESISGAIHEAGHGLYEQGFLPAYYGTPMAEAVSLGIHESQSRYWENQIGKSRAFWSRYFPKLHKLFPEQLKDTSEDEFYSELNRVSPSFIRVGADEVTYNLHIILRFEIEREMFNHNLDVTSIPAMWNEKMKDLLGITPSGPEEGFMQDVHWSVGLMGYFPTYALGNLYAAQLSDKLSKDVNNLDSVVQDGEFHIIREWMRKNIHQYGRQYSPSQLIQNATGEAPNAAYFNTYIKEKYSALYRL